MFQNVAKLNAIKCVLTSILMLLIMSGCATLKKLDNENEEPKKVELLVLTTANINPDVLERPSPIRLDIYQLSDTEEFARTDYFSLIDQNNDLNGQLIDRNEFMVGPDDIKSASLEISSDVNYLGVTVGYRDIDNSDWKIILLKQDMPWYSRNKYLNLKIDESAVMQLSKKDMKSELEQYAEKHQEEQKVNKQGKIKTVRKDYSKGVFVVQ